MPKAMTLNLELLAAIFWGMTLLATLYSAMLTRNMLHRNRKNDELRNRSWLDIQFESMTTDEIELNIKLILTNSGKNPAKNIKAISHTIVHYGPAEHIEDSKNILDYCILKDESILHCMPNSSIPFRRKLTIGEIKDLSTKANTSLKIKNLMSDAPDEQSDQQKINSLIINQQLTIGYHLHLEYKCNLTGAQRHTTSARVFRNFLGSEPTSRLIQSHSDFS